MAEATYRIEDGELIENTAEDIAAIEQRKADEASYDLEENKSLLLENNFENLNSISWDKGCYVGQEITARMKYRSLLKKKIYSLEIKDGSPLIGQLIKDDESEFGKIISIKNNSVLAMLKIELAEKKINIQVISTSEIKISVLIDRKNIKKAISVLHKEFKLDK